MSSEAATITESSNSNEADGGEKPDSISSYDHVKTLDQLDVKKAALTLFEAFRTDALAKHLTSHIDDTGIRDEIELSLYECYVSQHILKGLCLGINEGDDRFETVAVWSLPHSEHAGLESFNTLMESGFYKVWFVCDPVAREKIFQGMMNLLEDTFERIMSTDSRFKGKNVYTLVYLGSTKAARGKGNARRMFNYMFENYLDKTSNNIGYLESSSATNIPIYEKFGFKFYEDICLGNKAEGVEGKDYAVMNVMVRDSYAHDWTKDENLHVSKGKL